MEYNTYDTSVNVSKERFTELIHKEAQLEFIKKMLESKDDYASTTDLKLLLDIKKDETKDE